MDDQKKRETIERLERMGALDPTCEGCKETYEAPDPLVVFAPGHRASDRCESGKRDHCSCDACF